MRVSQRLGWLEPALALADTDVDGVADVLDNCTTSANAGQDDTDLDGYGNICDCDFDQTGSCNIDDFSVFILDYIVGTDSGVGSDMDSSGFVNIDDFSFFILGYIAGAPGPSALAP